MLPIFRVRLRNGASIGPTLLRHLWSKASGSASVDVSREPRTFGHASIHHTYFVSALAVPTDIPGVELELRRLLQERLCQAHVELTRLL